MPEENSLEIELPSTMDDLPEGVELATEETVEVVAEPYNHDANLAEVLDDSVLGALSSDLQSKVREDMESRQDWEEAIAKGLNLLGINYEDRSDPFLGASGVTHPLLSEATTQFQSQAYKEMLPSGGPVKTQILGVPNQQTEDQAQRVKDFMNYQIMEVMEEYDPDTDQMLFYLPLTGSTFKKVYFDQAKQRAVSKFVPAEDLIVPYSASDLMTAERVTHVVKMSYNDIRKLQVAGYIKMWSYLLQTLEKMKEVSKALLMSCKDFIQTILMMYTHFWKSMWILIWKALKIRMALCCRTLSRLMRILIKFYRWLGTIGNKTR